MIFKQNAGLRGSDEGFWGVNTRLRLLPQPPVGISFTAGHKINPNIRLNLRAGGQNLLSKKILIDAIHYRPTFRYRARNLVQIFNASGVVCLFFFIKNK